MSTMTFAFFSGVINQIIPYLVATVTFYTLFLYSILNFLILFPIYFFYVETAKRSLEDMDELFAAESPYFKAAERHFAMIQEQKRSEFQNQKPDVEVLEQRV
jgi:hypothetical protein